MKGTNTAVSHLWNKYGKVVRLSYFDWTDLEREIEVY